MIEHNTAVIADARLGLPAPADQKRMREEEADVEEVLEVGGQRAEVGGQRAEVGGQRSEDGEFADVL
jgi:hypothetical protein